MAFALLVHNALMAVTTKPLSLTLEQSIERALSENPSLQAARTWIDQAQGRRQQAGRLDNPELKLDYSTDRTFNDEGERSYGFGFEQRFPITNRLRLEKRIALDEIELAHAEIENQIRILSQRVATAYLQVVEAERQIALREQLLVLYADFLDFVESRVETGEASMLEVHQVQIERYSVQQEMQALENAHIVQLSHFGQLIGLEAGVPVKLTFDFKLPSDLPSLVDFSPAMLESHPAYQMKALLAQMAETQISVEKASRWADVALEIFYSEERGVDAPNGAGRDRFFGVGVSIPLPLMDTKQGAIAASRAKRQQFQFEVQAEAAKLIGDARMHRSQVKQLYQQARAYDETLTQLVGQNIEEMTAGYTAGQIGLAEMFRAQGQAFKIQSAQLSILYDYEQALIDWKAATARQSHPTQVNL